MTEPKLEQTEPKLEQTEVTTSSGDVDKGTLQCEFHVKVWENAECEVEIFQRAEVPRASHVMRAQKDIQKAYRRLKRNDRSK